MNEEQLRREGLAAIDKADNAKDALIKELLEALKGVMPRDHSDDCALCHPSWGMNECTCWLDEARAVVEKAEG